MEFRLLWIKLSILVAKEVSFKNYLNWCHFKKLLPGTVVAIAQKTNILWFFKKIVFKRSSTILGASYGWQDLMVLSLISGAGRVKFSIHLFQMFLNSASKNWGTFEANVEGREEYKDEEKKASFSCKREMFMKILGFKMC